MRYNKARKTLGSTPDVFDFLENKARTSGIVLYGAGSLLQSFVGFMERSRIPIKAICDTYRHGGMLGNYRIVSVDEMLAIRGDTPIFILTVQSQYVKEMRHSLLEHGISEGSIFSVYDACVEKCQYFLPDIVGHMADEVFVDAGVFDADTLLLFQEFSRDMSYRRIYGFEPSAINFEKAKAVVRDRGLKNVTLFNKGLWDTAERLGFNDSGDGAAHIEQNSGLPSIETIALDEVITVGDKVTFIKMDIEGAELNALRGARGTITQEKPRLAICVYHKPEDIVEIPSYILSLRPDYKFYLRQHSALSVLETLLYAV